MGLKPDHWITRMAHEHRMIEPFQEAQVRDGVISFGVSSYGYDIRVADEFKIFTNVYSAVVDPKHFDPKSMVDFKGAVCVIPPNSFALARTVEYFRIPRTVLTVCLGKSTYARCGIIVNVTPFEPEWEGFVTLEISNTTPLPARIYANEGIAQVLFFEADEVCTTSYADKKGKYQKQQTIELPRLQKEGCVASQAAVQSGRTLSSLWRAIFLVSFPFGIVGFLLPVYGRELGATALQVGVFFSAFAIVPILVRPVLGRALDRWGRRPFLLIGVAGYLAAAVVFALASSVAMLTVARFVQGLGSAFLWLTAYAMVADLATAGERGLSFGLIDEATNRGGIIGTTIGFTMVIVLQQSGQMDWGQVWLSLFVVYTITTAAALVVAWRGAGETRPPDRAKPPSSHSISRSLIILMGIVLLTGASSAMVWPLLVIFLQDSLHAPVNELALAYLPAALVSSFLPSRMGVVSDRLGRKKPMILGLLVGAAASALIPQLRSLIGLAALWAIESAGYAASIPAERAFVADIAGEDVRGTSYGLYTFALFLGMALGPLVGGWLYDEVGPASPFYANSVALLFGALLVGLALREPSPAVVAAPAAAA